MKIGTYRRSSLKSALWDLHRFGFTPTKLRQRAIVKFYGSHARRLLVTSLPKAGTHLVETVLCLHPGIYRAFVPTLEERHMPSLNTLARYITRLKPGAFLVSHLPYRNTYFDLCRREGVLVASVIRDPRAVLFSSVLYIDARRDHYLHAAQARLNSQDAKIRFHLDGAPELGLPPFSQILAGHLEWEKQPNVLAVRFEDLVGPSGGGHAATQKRTIARLFDFLGVERPEPWLNALTLRIPTTSTPTFRRGHAWAWREELGGPAVQEINQRLGDLIEASGYRPTSSNCTAKYPTLSPEREGEQ